MPICMYAHSAKRYCLVGDVEQHEDEFKSNGMAGGKTKGCKTCRDRMQWQKGQRLHLAEAIGNRRAQYLDSWLKVCDRCPLVECLTEGDESCPIRIAKGHGWDATEALYNAEGLGLIEPVIWGEF